jgi:hypothetical protein
VPETNNAIENPAALPHAEKRDLAQASLWWAEDRDPASLSDAEERQPAPTALWYWAEDNYPAALS